MNLLIKIFFWVALLVVFLLLSIFGADYFDWQIWQQMLCFVSLIAATLAMQWSWRRYKIKRHFKSLSINHNFNFNASKAWHLGLHQFQNEQHLTKQSFKQKPWYVGIAFREIDAFKNNTSVVLDNNNTNVRIRLIALDEMFVLQFEFTSRLVLEREMEIYQQYFLMFEKSFRKHNAGLLLYLDATGFEQLDAQRVTELSDTLQKIIEKAQAVSAQHHPVQIIFHNIQKVVEYPAFLVRLSRKTKMEAFGWQSTQLAFYNADIWLDIDQNIRHTLLERTEYAFANNLRISSVEDYQLLTHIKLQLGSLRTLFDTLSNRVSFCVGGVFWVESLDNLKAGKYKPFASKLFEKHLPAVILKPMLTSSALAVKSAQRKLAITAYFMVVAIALYHLTSCYFHANKALGNIIGSLPTRVYFHNKLTPDLKSLGSYQVVIDSIDSQLTEHAFTLFPYQNSFDLLRKYYVRAYERYFQRFILNNVNKNLTNVLHSSAVKKDSKLRVALLIHIMDRVNLINAKLSNQPLSGLEGPPLWNNQLSIFDNPQNSFSELYKKYIFYTVNNNALREERTFLLTMAAGLHLEKDNFRWLPQYINTNSGIKPITLNDIWGGSNIVHIHNDQIDPCFTFDGSEAIGNFWVNFNQAFAQLNDFSLIQADFLQWYQNVRYLQWTNFLEVFPQGYKTLNNKGEWDTIYINMASVNGISQSLFQTIQQQFSDVISQDTRIVLTPPAWLILTQKLNLILSYAVKDGVISKAKNRFINLDQIIQYVSQRKSDLNTTEQAKVYYFDTLDQPAVAAKDFYNYSQAVSALYQPVTLPEQAFLNSKSIYASNNAVFNTALNSQQTMMYRFNSLGLQDNVFWQIYQVPLEFYVRYMNFVSNIYLNQAWQEDVLGKVQNSPTFFVSDLLFSEKGIFWTFFNKYLTNYFVIQNSNVVPKFYFDIPYPFTDDFYTLVISAASRYSLAKEQSLFKKYFADDNANTSAPAAAATGLPPLSQVGAPTPAPSAVITPVPISAIVALPPSLNAEAKVQPQQITLVANCAKGNFELTNYNFPIEKSLPQPLNDCLKASVKIFFDDFTLEKNYAGPTGLLDFLNGLTNNSVTFSEMDFPESASYLQQYHIDTIKLNYKVTGLSNMMRQYAEFLKMQKSLFKEEKNYSSIADLPTIITFDNINDEPSLRAMLSATNTLVWKKDALTKTKK